MRCKQLLLMVSSRFLIGERKAVEKTLQAGEDFGYGNLIGWLATEWAMRLMEGGLSKEAAINHVSGRGPYEF